MKIQKFNAEEKRRKTAKQLKANKSKVPVDLEKWCKLTGAKFGEREEAEEKVEEETAFDDSFFEEFSRDFLEQPGKRGNRRK